jgi:hypothetical protein
MTSQAGSICASESEINVRMAGQKNLVIVGATRMVGGYALRYALEHPAVGRATTIGRKKVGISHPRLKEVLHQDFADCSALAEVLSDQHAATFCLGAYTGAELRTITVVGALSIMGAADALLSGRKKPGKIVVSATMWASEAD